MTKLTVPYSVLRHGNQKEIYPDLDIILKQLRPDWSQIPMNTPHFESWLKQTIWVASGIALSQSESTYLRLPDT